MKRLGLSLLGLVLGFSCAEPPPPAAPPPPPAVAPAAPAAEPEVDRSQLPAPGPIVNWAPPTPSVSALKNGIKVWHTRWGSTPLVSLMVIIPRGTATDPKAKAGLTYLMADMLDEGAGKLSALELSDQLQRLGTDYSASASVDYVLLSMDLLAENFQASIDLLADIIERPTFSPAEFKRRKDHRIAQALANESDPGTAQRAALLDVLFSDGYAGTLDQGTQKSLKPISLFDVKTQYKKLVVPEGIEFVVVGGIDEATVKSELDRAFGTWKGAAKTAAREVSEQPSEKGVYVVDFPGAAQSVLTVARRAEGANTEKYFPAMVFNRSFGEAFTSRLNLNLREDKGYTYGARSSFQRFRQVGYFALSAAVKSETTRASIDEMLKELTLACGEKPISAQERDESVGGLLLGYPGRFERIASVGANFATLAIYQRPADWFHTWPSNVERVTLEAANAIAKEYCNPDQFAIVLAGDRAKLEPTLTSLGRSLVHYDAQGTRLK